MRQLVGIDMYRISGESSILLPYSTLTETVTHNCGFFFFLFFFFSFFLFFFFSFFFFSFFFFLFSFFFFLFLFLFLFLFSFFFSSSSFFFFFSSFFFFFFFPFLSFLVSLFFFSLVSPRGAPWRVGGFLFYFLVSQKGRIEQVQTIVRHAGGSEKRLLLEPAKIRICKAEIV